MAKNSHSRKSRNHSTSAMSRKVGRFCDLVGRRLRSATTANSRGRSANSSSSSSSHSQQPFSSPVRFVFVLAATPVLLLFAGLLAYAHLGDASPEALGLLRTSPSVTAHLRYLLLRHQSTVEFISAAVVAIQVMAVLGAVMNWPTVLFAYVVITGLLGTVVGVVGIFGVVFSLIFGGSGGGHGGSSPPDHSNLFAVLLVVAFILLFYLLTILGLKLMAYMRRRGRDRSFHDEEGYGASRTSKRAYRHSPVARRGVKRSSYKSIDAISSPFNDAAVEVDMGDVDEDEEEEEDVFDEEEEDEIEGSDGAGGGSQLQQIFDSRGRPSLSTLLPPSQHHSANQSSSSQRPTSGSASSFAFSV